MKLMILIKDIKNNHTVDTLIEKDNDKDKCHNKNGKKTTIIKNINNSNTTSDYIKGKNQKKKK